MKKAYITAFECCPLFSGIDSKDTEKIITDFAQISTYQKNQTVFTAKEFARGLVIIIKGSAAVTKSTGNGNLLINILKKGDVFGMATLFFEKEDYLTDIVSKEQLTVAFINKENVQKIFSLYPMITENYITILSSKIHFLNKKISTYTKSEAVSKVAELIINNANSEKTKAVLPFSLTTASELLNLGRASVYRAIEALENECIIRREGKNILILDYNKLLNK